jgi:hypothetical protein
MTPERAEEITTAFFDKLERVIVSKYRRYLSGMQNMVCKLQNRTIGSIGKKVCLIDPGSLHDAYAEMKNDIRACSH